MVHSYPTIMPAFPLILFPALPFHPSHRLGRRCGKVNQTSTLVHERLNLGFPFTQVTKVMSATGKEVVDSVNRLVKVIYTILVYKLFPSIQDLSEVDS